jgi:predicted nucleotidyltransferase component of viral defense system
MSSPSSSPRVPDLDAWVAKAQANPVQYRQRQVTHILLHAVARDALLRESLCLKGGTLMSAIYGSIRQTGDVDFSASAAPEPFTTRFREVLDKALRVSATDLGYLDLDMRVQKFDPQPRGFAEAPAPGLQMSIGIAVRNTNAQSRLEQGRAVEVLDVDISFKEPIINVQIVEIGGTGHSLFAYSTEDLIAEKLRALVQQKSRNRRRRQDIYDISWLIENVALSEDAHARILSSFLEKSYARDVDVAADALDDPELRQRAAADWHTMALEIGALPDFDAVYERVRSFYRGLPWEISPPR